MTADDRPRFSKAMTLLAATFNQPMNELRLEGYFMALQSADVEDIEGAIRDTLKTSRFMPTPAELLDAIFGSADALADASWNDWRRQASQLGAYGDPILDRATKLALRDVFGGWTDACLVECSPEMFANKRKQFLTAYKRYWEQSDPRFSLPEHKQPKELKS